MSDKLGERNFCVGTGAGEDLTHQSDMVIIHDDNGTELLRERNPELSAALRGAYYHQQYKISALLDEMKFIADQFYMDDRGIASPKTMGAVKAAFITAQNRLKDEGLL